MPTPIIEAHRLTKRFGKITALADFELTAQGGRVAAVLGPNGAGKTTFVRSVATLVRPDSGSLHVAGIDSRKQPADVRRAIGLAGQYAAIEEAMTGRENLHMVARLFGLNRRHAKSASSSVLEQLGLADDADRLVRNYSGGMRRRLDLGASLVGSPRLLLLDEPTSGLDPRSRIELWDAIRHLVAEGTDVLLTTQYLDEADQLAQDVFIIDHGNVIAAGTPAELKNQMGRDVIEVHVRTTKALDAAASALGPLGSEVQVDRDTRWVQVAVEAGTDRLADALRVLDGLGIAVDEIGLRRPTLDEVFLTLTGRPGTTPQTDPEPDKRRHAA